MIRHGANNVPVTEVCLHTAATPGSWYTGKSVEDMVKEIRRWHVGYHHWSDIGYHRVIAPNGDIGIGRSIYRIGAGVKGHNTGVIHLCLIPVNTHNGIKNFEDYFTEQQKDSVISYINELKELTPIHRISGHNEFAAKECPGFYVQNTDWLQALTN